MGTDGQDQWRYDQVGAETGQYLVRHLVERTRLATRKPLRLEVVACHVTREIE